MLFRSIIISTTALLSFASVPTGAVPGSVVQETKDGLNVHFSEELVQIVTEDPESYKERVLDAFLREADALQEQSTTGARTLKRKKGKKKSPKAAGLSAECRQDELTACALFQFIYSSALSVSVGSDDYGSIFNETSCDVLDTTAVCDLNNFPGLFTFNATECVNDYGGQVINTQRSYSILYSNITSFVLENFPFCIPTTCDPKAFVEFATGMSSIRLPSDKSGRRRMETRNLQSWCYL